MMGAIALFNSNNGTGHELNFSNDFTYKTFYGKTKFIPVDLEVKIIISDLFLPGEAICLKINLKNWSDKLVRQKLVLQQVTTVHNNADIEKSHCKRKSSPTDLVTYYTCPRVYPGGKECT